MKKFKFKMDFFLSYQIYQKMQYEEKLSEAVQKYIGIKTKNEINKKKFIDQKAKANKYTDSLEEGDTSHSYFDYFSYLKNIESTLIYNQKENQNKLNKVELECKDIKKNWLFFYKKVKAMQILKEKEYKSYLKNMQKQEDEEFNEIFVIKNFKKE